MPPYTYQSLSVEDEEIRLMRLMPGEADEDIVFSILHARLVPQNSKPVSKHLSIEEVQQTLPQELVVRETLEGRYLFMSMGDDGPFNSWTHPDPNFDHKKLPQPQQEVQDFEPAYEALSYTWGSTADPVTVRVVNASRHEQSQATMSIGQNLACALTHLRRQHVPRTLWVDAICINQDDINERNAQVKRMGLIYSLAYKVVIWLGPEADDSTHALSTIDYFGRQVECLVYGYIGDSPGATEPMWWDQGYVLPYDDRTWSSLIALFRRPWFGRVWVLQEALLANHQAMLQCGHTSYPWSNFRKAVLGLENRRGLPRWLMDWLPSYINALDAGLMRNTQRLLIWASHRQCTDPRDKIYGILSVLPPSIAERIEPQYSIPTFQIYKDMFLKDLVLVKRLGFLPHCNIEQRNDGGPSWIPNWSTADIMGHQDSKRQASGLSDAHARYLPPDTLEVVGKRCARIRSVGAAASSKTADNLPLIRQWEPEGLYTEDYVAGGSLFDAFLEVLTGGNVKDRYTTISYFPTMTELRSEYLALFWDRSSDSIDDKARTFKELMSIHHLSMFTTHDGYLGMAAPGVMKDDIVCVLLGCDCPMLLRPTDSGYFSVVGPCFVHGLMDAESLLGPVPDPWQLSVWTGDDRRPHFYNTSTNESTFEDPRLPPLPSEWEIHHRERMQEDPFYFLEFRNSLTGEIRNSDPRMVPEALISRGVKLETFRLV